MASSSSVAAVASFNCPWLIICSFLVMMVWLGVGVCVEVLSLLVMLVSRLTVSSTLVSTECCCVALTPVSFSSFH